MRLKEIRLEKNYDLECLAKYLEITPEKLIEWEEGVSEPNVTSLIKLALLYDVSIDYLVNIDDKRIAKNATIITTDTETFNLVKDIQDYDDNQKAVLKYENQKIKDKSDGYLYKVDYVAAENSSTSNILDMDDDIPEHN